MSGERLAQAFSALLLGVFAAGQVGLVMLDPASYPVFSLAAGYMFGSVLLKKRDE